MMAVYAAAMVGMLPASLAAQTGASGLYSSYVSLSIELIGFPSWAGTKASRNDFSNNLISNLVFAQRAPMVVRVGGNSADRAIFDATLTTPTASSCKNADPGAWQCIGPSFFDSYGAFPAGTLYAHNFNLATWNSSGEATLEATVPLACKALQGHLEAFEVGNEPDLYIGSRRPSDYSAAQYVDEWTNRTARFEELLRETCPDMARNIKYIFPSVSSPGARLHAADIFAALGEEDARRISQVSVHNYMGGATQPGVTLQKTLMNHTAVVRSIAGHVKYAASVNGSADYVIGEHNSLYGGGAAGLSNTFGAALWAMEFSLYAASTGVIKRLHFHQSVGSPYAAWSPVNPPRTKAPYYGKLAAATFLADSRNIKVEVLPVEGGGDPDTDVAYGALEGGRLRRIAALNLREYDGEGTRGQKEHSFEVAAASTWVVKRLAAAEGATAQTGITFNGFRYEADSVGRPVRVGGTASDEEVRADGDGRLAVTVADSEAVVLVKR